MIGMRWVICILFVHLLQAEVVTLEHDLRHTGKGSPFKTSQSEKLVITSTSKKAVILTSGCVWDLSNHFNVEFAGNAKLMCESGSQLHGNSGVLRFVDEAQFVVGKE